MLFNVIFTVSPLFKGSHVARVSGFKSSSPAAAVKSAFKKYHDTIAAVYDMAECTIEIQDPQTGAALASGSGRVNIWASAALYIGFEPLPLNWD